MVTKPQFNEIAMQSESRSYSVKRQDIDEHV